MAWKLKKATPERNAAEPNSPAASEQTIDYSAIVGPPPTADDTAVPAQFVPDDNGNGIDFLSSRTQAADEAVDSFTFAKQNAAPGASGKNADSHDDWSLDAFAPYQPPAAFDFNDTPADEPSLTRAGMIDFDAEPESLLGSADSGVTSLESSPLQPSEFGVIDLDAAPEAEAQPLHAFDSNGHAEPDALHFAPMTDIAADLDEDWQLGEAGQLDTSEAEGVSSEPTLLSGIASQPDVFAAASAPAMPLPPPLPAFDEPSKPQSALQAQPPIAPEPIAAAPATPAPIDKTLLYGEAADEPGIGEPQGAPAQPQLIVKFGPFSASYPITADDLVIGRPDPNTGVAPSVSLEYDDAVSRRHARVYSDGGQIMLEDLGSKNGTSLNGSPIMPHSPVPLKPGDKIRVGERTEIAFQQ